MSESKPLELEELIDDNHYDDLLSFIGLDRMNMKKLKNLTNAKNVDEILDDENQRHLVEELGVDVNQVKTILTLSKAKNMTEALDKEEFASTLQVAGVNTNVLREGQRPAEQSLRDLGITERLKSSFLSLKRVEELTHKMLPP